jgi:hypothetical protein
MSTYEREASGAEKYFVAFNELRPPFIIQLALEGIGEPDPESLDDALERTALANPGSSIKLDKNRDPETWVLGPRPTLTLVDAPEFEGRHGNDAPFLMWDLNSYEGPTCELLFVKGKNRNYLIFRALHAVMDGQGTLLWVKDFMRCLRGEEPIGHPGTSTVDQLIREIKAKRRVSVPNDAIHPFGMPNLARPGTFAWKRIVVDRPLDSGVSGRIAVALAAAARTRAEGKVRINLPTDLRHYRPNERTTGNFFNSLFVEIAPGAQAEMVGMKIVQMLYKDEGTKGMGTFAGDYAATLAAHRVKVLWDLTHLHDTGRYAFSATLSHLGALKSAELSSPSFATNGAFFIPLVGDSGCVLAINGFDEHTEACVGLSDRFTEHGELDQLEDLVKTAILGS